MLGYLRGEYICYWRFRRTGVVFLLVVKQWPRGVRPEVYRCCVDLEKVLISSDITREGTRRDTFISLENPVKIM